MPEEIASTVPMEEKFEGMEYLPRKIRLPKKSAESGGTDPVIMEEMKVCRYHIDKNAHMNNSRYLQLAQECKYRICIINKNVPNVVGAITTALANVGVNIENMANKGKKDYAYMILDTNDEVSEELMERLRSREGIINARLITAKA